jgi:hypothetical protein
MSRLAKDPTLPRDDIKADEIIAAAKAAPPRNHGNSVQGWQIRLRNRLVKEAGFTYNEACRTACAIIARTA